MNVTTCALNGGEDYELLFTVPLTEHERVSAIEGIKAVSYTHLDVYKRQGTPVMMVW